MKIIFNYLNIEVTRRCNMRCAHCLRGDQMNLDIDTKYISKLLHHTSAIGSLCFTGGEPTMNLHAIKYTRKLCEKLGIPVSNFYIVTNGKKVTMDFVEELLKWYAYCDDTDMCGIALSKDDFHEKIPAANEALLRGLSFFREDKFTDFTSVPVINMGRAQSITDYAKRDKRPETLFAETIDTHIVVESDVTLTCKGEMISGCDYAYNDTAYCQFGTINDMSALKRVLNAVAA